MKSGVLQLSQLRMVVARDGYNVKVLAASIGVTTRTLERRFEEQLHETPKAWLMRERLDLAPAFLADGFSNKEIAARLNYTCESNFCRDFKRRFGCSPQQFLRPARAGMSHSDK